MACWNPFIDDLSIFFQVKNSIFIKWLSMKTPLIMIIFPYFPISMPIFWRDFPASHGADDAHRRLHPPNWAPTNFCPRDLAEFSANKNPRQSSAFSDESFLKSPFLLVKSTFSDGFLWGTHQSHSQVEIWFDYPGLRGYDSWGLQSNLKIEGPTLSSG